jgi:hypothetical protein
MNGTAAPQPTSSPSSQAITALVLGILGLITCQLLAPIAWYLGRQESRAIREGRAPAAGQTLATLAVALGIAGTVLFVLIVLWIAFWGGLAILTGFFSH